MRVIVNGEEHEFADRTNVAEIVHAYGPQRTDRGVAVAVNGEVVRRTEWGGIEVGDGDRVEVLVAIGGG